MKKLFIFATSILLSAISFTAHAKNSNNENFYLKLNLGQNIGKTGNNAAISAGTLFSDSLSLEISLGGASQALVMEKMDETAYKVTGYGTNKIIYGMINAYYHFNTYSQAWPYVMLGGGMSRAKTDVTQTVITYKSYDKKESSKDTYSLSSSNKNYITYQLGFGVRIMPDEGYSFDVGYRLMNIDNGGVKDNIVNGISFPVNIKLKDKYSHSISIGASINF